MIRKTNICCLDLDKDSLDYLKSLDLNVFEGTIGSTFLIHWAQRKDSVVPVTPDCRFPENIHEYHVLIHDMSATNQREYHIEEHRRQRIKSEDERHIECKRPISQLDLRPLGSHYLNTYLEKSQKYISIVFVDKEVEVTYQTNGIVYNDVRQWGPYSNYEAWGFVPNKAKVGERVKLVDNVVSKSLFERRLSSINYSSVFYAPKVHDDNLNWVDDNRLIPLLYNEDDECVSYAFVHNDDRIDFVFPQVDNKSVFLKDLFESLLFPSCSHFFPDIEAKYWIHKSEYSLPGVAQVNQLIVKENEEHERKLKEFQGQIDSIKTNLGFLHDLITESSTKLVDAMVKYLNWLGFEGVEKADDDVKEGEVFEEDIHFTYNDTLVLIEVKGLHGTSTDSDCSQIDKIVHRRIHDLGKTNVHGVYVVNNERSVELLKRTIPPFNETQIKDAIHQYRTMMYTAQLYALYFDVENGFISRETARRHFLLDGLADFHSGFVSIGKPYSYYNDNHVICFDLSGTKITVGDSLYYEDRLNKLVCIKVKNLQQNHESFGELSEGKTGIEVNDRVPRNCEFFKLIS